MFIVLQHQDLGKTCAQQSPGCGVGQQTEVLQLCDQALRGLDDYGFVGACPVKKIKQNAKRRHEEEGEDLKSEKEDAGTKKRNLERERRQKMPKKCEKLSKECDSRHPQRMVPE